VIGFEANRRLLEVEKISHDCILTEEQLQQLNHSQQLGQQRVSALRFGDRNVQALCHAVLMFDALPVGFSISVCANISHRCSEWLLIK
jgi:hypothetical protein